MQGISKNLIEKAFPVAERPDYLTGAGFYKSGSSWCPKSTLPYAGYLQKPGRESLSSSRATRLPHRRWFLQIWLFMVC